MLWRRDIKLIADVLLISLIIPLGDLFALLMQGIHERVKFIDHFLFIALTIASVVLRAHQPGREPSTGVE